MNPKALSHLYEIRVAANRILTRSAGVTLEDYLQDDDLRDIVENRFKIIGEYVTRLRRDDPETLNQITGHESIIAFRNNLVHEYEKVDNSRVWEIIQQHLPLLAQEVDDLLESAGGTNDHGSSGVVMQYPHNDKQRSHNIERNIQVRPYESIGHFSQEEVDPRRRRNRQWPDRFADGDTNIEIRG